MDYRIVTPVPKDSLDLLLYEIRMMENSFPSRCVPKDFFEKNVRLESFLLHARNLINFLENNKKTSDDIVVSDFKDVNGVPFQRIQLSLSSDIKKRINKHLSHLTKVRLKEKPEWNISAIRNTVNQGLSQFLNQVSDNHFPTIAGRTKKDFNNLINNSL